MNTEELCILREALEKLPKLDREIFILRYIHGYTQDEVADKLKLTQSMVSRILKKYDDYQRIPGT